MTLFASSIECHGVYAQDLVPGFLLARSSLKQQTYYEPSSNIGVRPLVPMGAMGPLTTDPMGPLVHGPGTMGLLHLSIDDNRFKNEQCRLFE